MEGLILDGRFPHKGTIVKQKTKEQELLEEEDQLMKKKDEDLNEMIDRPGHQYKNYERV